MSGTWLRVRPAGRDDLAAGFAALGVAALAAGATFYLTRLLLAREPVVSPEEPRTGRRHRAKAGTEGA